MPQDKEVTARIEKLFGTYLEPSKVTMIPESLRKPKVIPAKPRVKVKTV